MPLDSDLRGFEVDPNEPFARYARWDRAPGWVVFIAALGLFVAFVAAMWALGSSKLLEPLDIRWMRGGTLAFVVVLATLLVLHDRRRGSRIQRRLRREGLPPAQAIFAVRPGHGRNLSFGTALAFLPGEIVVVHGTGTRSLTRIGHQHISSIEHLERARVNHVAVHTDGTAYLFNLWPYVLLPQPPFGSVFVPPRASSRAPGSDVLREAILRSGISFTAERIR